MGRSREYQQVLVRSLSQETRWEQVPSSPLSTLQKPMGHLCRCISPSLCCCRGHISVTPGYRLLEMAPLCTRSCRRVLCFLIGGTAPTYQSLVCHRYQVEGSRILAGGGRGRGILQGNGGQLALPLFLVGILLQGFSVVHTPVALNSVPSAEVSPSSSVLTDHAHTFWYSWDF